MTRGADGATAGLRRCKAAGLVIGDESSGHIEKVEATFRQIRGRTKDKGLEHDVLMGPLLLTVDRHNDKHIQTDEFVQFIQGSAGPLPEWSFASANSSLLIESREVLKLEDGFGCCGWIARLYERAEHVVEVLVR